MSGPKRLLRTLTVFAWTALFLAIFDFAINRMFPYPKDQHTPPTTLQRYFDYGRSVKGKLTREVGRDDHSASALVQAGWVSAMEDLGEGPSSKSAPAGEDRIAVTSYGMSFSTSIVTAASELDHRLAVTCLGGPAAPANHSYALYDARRPIDHSQVVVLGILASDCKAITTVSHMTWQFEAPAAYTYPRYRSGDAMIATWPSIRTLAQMRAALADPQKWAQFESELAANDRFYDPVLIGGAWLDCSSVVRLARRGYAQRQYRARAAEIEGNGFTPESEMGSTLIAIVRSFHRTARSDGKLPIVMLIHDRGYSDELYRLLSPTLKSEGITFVSTHELVPTNNPRNFVPDGHFTAEGFRRIGAALIGVINSNGVTSTSIKKK